MEELDLIELVKLFWKKKLPIIGIIAVFIVMAIIYTKVIIVPQYQSTTTILFATDCTIDNTKSGQIITTDNTLNAELIPTFVEILKSDKVIKEIKTNLGIEENIKSAISVETKSYSEMMIITVKHVNAEIAQKIANESAKVLIENVKEYYKLENVYILDEAQVAGGPYNVNLVKNVIVFACIGLIISIIYVLIINMIGTKEKTSSN